MFFFRNLSKHIFSKNIFWFILLSGVYIFVENTTNMRLVPYWFLVVISFLTFAFGIWFFSHFIQNTNNNSFLGVNKLNLKSLLSTKSEKILFDESVCIDYSQIKEPVIINNQKQHFFIIQNSEGNIEISRNTIIEINQQSSLIGVLSSQKTGGYMQVKILSLEHQNSGNNPQYEYPSNSDDPFIRNSQTQIPMPFATALVIYQINNIEVSDQNSFDNMQPIKDQKINFETITALINIALSKTASEVVRTLNKEILLLNQIQSAFIQKCNSGLLLGIFKISIVVDLVAFINFSFSTPKIFKTAQTSEQYSANEHTKQARLIKYQLLRDKYFSNFNQDKNQVYEELYELFR